MDTTELTANRPRITKQYLLPEFVLALYETGAVGFYPYEITENGENFVGLFPNAAIDDARDILRN